MPGAPEPGIFELPGVETSAFIDADSQATAAVVAVHLTDFASLARCGGFLVSAFCGFNPADPFIPGD
jgi:hypothetical protein